jgi:uncharacterized RDD family membrane protein YckC
MTPAAIQRRIAAFLIDQVLLFGVVIGLSLALGVNRGDVGSDSGAVAAVGLVGIAVAIAYHSVAVARFGRTVGKQLMGLRVVALPEGRQVLWSYAALRALVPAAVVLLPVVGSVAGLAVYLWAVFDPRRQGLHDKLAGTMVVPTVTTTLEPPSST